MGVLTLGILILVAAVVGEQAGPLPAFISQPDCGEGTSVCAGTTVTVPTSVTNATAYQWYKGNTPVNGQTSATLTISNAQTAATGVYSLSASGPNGTVISNTFALTVNPSPTNPSLTTGTLTCMQTSLTLNASASNGTSYTFSRGTPVGINQVVASQPGATPLP